MSLFLRGMAIGFSIAAPVGPIGVLCIRRTLARGRTSGFVSGLGAATADACYGGVAAFGLSTIARALARGQLGLRMVGGAFLIYLGIRTFLAKPADSSNDMRANSLWGDYFSTLGLTLTNPATILSFAAIFAGLGLGAAGGGSPLATVSGVFLGSAAWWLLLSGGIDFLRERSANLPMAWINRLAGLTLTAFGLAALFV